MMAKQTYLALAVCLLSLLSVVPRSLAATRQFEFDIAYANFTRNCYDKPLLVVNGQFPGPRIDVTEGDRVIVKVTNSADTNLTIHWHGVRQFLSAWQDGAAYVTNCPIQPGDYFTYDFVVADQRGTTFWHAHVNWERATVHGAFVIHPLTQEYPFSFDEEFLMVLGEWYNDDVEAVRASAIARGTGPGPATALTINGYLGPFCNCSEDEDTPQFDIEHGKTYLLRVINAAVNSDIYFGIANHLLTVVETDASYVQPMTVDQGIPIAPGQTVSVLLVADQPSGSYYAAALGHEGVFVINIDASRAPDDIGTTVPLVPAAVIFQYVTDTLLANRFPFYPVFPDRKDMVYTDGFHGSLRAKYPVELPSNAKVRKMFFAIGMAAEYCTEEYPCPRGVGGYYRFAVAMNNFTFLMPNTSILEAYYYNISDVFTEIPDHPLVPFNYTDPVSPPESDLASNSRTGVIMVEYGTSIEIVLQDTHNVAFITHPFHLHGYSFYIIGSGSGNFNPETDPQNFNYYDPPSRYTGSLVQAGWVAIRFKADNPGD